MKKALFLDRDGIINVDHGYVHQKEQFEFVDGIFELCLHAQQLGFYIIVVTNQAGIARGYYTISDFEQLTEWMKVKFAEKNIVINDVFFCPHHPTQGNQEYKQSCHCRKPEPGMILTAKEKYNIDLKSSILIGDKTSDIKAAQSAGINNRILVASQYNDSGDVSAHRVTNIKQAIQFVG